jgi:hypothetical protein
MDIYKIPQYAVEWIHLISGYVLLAEYYAKVNEN